jgi:hypothetical protein
LVKLAVDDSFVSKLFQIFGWQNLFQVKKFDNQNSRFR